LLLTGCAPMPAYEIVACPPSNGWTDEDRDALFWEEHQADFKKRYPHCAAALEEYTDMKADRCAFFSGLREYQ
jgi:hypothetical protein